MGQWKILFKKKKVTKFLNCILRTDKLAIIAPRKVELSLGAFVKN